MEKEYITLPELSEYMGRPISTLRHWIRKGHIPYYKPEKHLYFRLSEIRAWIEMKDEATHLETEK